MDNLQCHFYRYTLNEVVALIEEDHAAVSADIFITPPSDDVTSEDRGDDDQPTNINHLSLAKLSAETNVRIHTSMVS